MFYIAFIIGIYSYSIFFLGILGLLTKLNIWLVTFFCFVVFFIVERKFFYSLINRVYKKGYTFSKKSFNSSQIILCFLVLLIILQALINLNGALGPELAFDALWYHLTLPQLYLHNHMIYHIPGGLLYYGDMPKLGEMLYVGALSLWNEILAKIFHYLFGLLIAISLYKFSRKFFSKTIAYIIVVIFYSNLVVDWESITAYIDLIRTFFEFLSLWSLINWYESKKYTWLLISSLMMGFAITTKLLAVGSFLVIFVIYLAMSIYKRNTIKDIFTGAFLYTFITFIIPLPWFIFSFIHTGNPVFPFFTKIYEVSASSPNPALILSDLWNLFIHSADPITPIYLIFLPLLFIFYSKFTRELKFLVWYCGLSLVLWYFTPRTGGGRFILPYLPAFSLVCGAIYSEMFRKKDIFWKNITKILFLIIIFVSCISIIYRGIANKRYMPVIFGQESKEEFLAKNLNFRFGDFYDTDNYFAEKIKPSEKVLLYGFHNLYYIDFPFIDASWVLKGDEFNYIATQNTSLPVKYRNWKLVYSNNKTMVQLYRPPLGACQKICRY